MGTKVLPELIVEEFSNVIRYKQTVKCQRDVYLDNPDVNVWRAIKHPSKLFNLLDIYTVDAIGQIFVVKFTVAGILDITKNDTLYLLLEDEDSKYTYAFDSRKFKTKYFSADNFTVVNALVNLNYSTDDNIQCLIDIKNAIDKKDIINVTIDFYHNKTAKENAKILPSYYRELHSSERYTNIIESYKEED